MKKRAMKVKKRFKLVIPASKAKVSTKTSDGTSHVGAIEDPDEEDSMEEVPVDDPLPQITVQS